MLKNLYLISGKSGSEKAGIVDRLCEQYGYHVLRSHTTRKPRHKRDEDYIFSDLSCFHVDKQNGLIATCSVYEKNYYWTTRSQILKSDLYVVGKEEIISLQQSGINRNVVAIYLEASEETRLKRMRLRGDNYDKVWERLKQDEKSFKGIKESVDFIVDGENENAWEMVRNIIESCEKLNYRREINK